MVAFVAWGERFGVEEQRVCGVPVLFVSLRQGRGRDARRAARLLSRAGVRRAAFPEAFSSLPAFAAHGILPAEQTPLREARAAALLRLCLRQRGLRPEALTLVLCGAAPSRALAEAVHTLCTRMRYLRLDLDTGGAALAAQLRRTLGVSPRLCAPPSVLRENEAALLFAPRCIAPGAGLVLPLYDDALRVTWRVRGETLQTPQAAALFGALGAEEFFPVEAGHLTGMV